MSEQPLSASLGAPRTTAPGTQRSARFAGLQNRCASVFQRTRIACAALVLPTRLSYSATLCMNIDTPPWYLVPLEDVSLSGGVMGAMKGTVVALALGEYS